MFGIFLVKFYCLLNRSMTVEFSTTGTISFIIFPGRENHSLQEVQQFNKWVHTLPFYSHESLILSHGEAITIESCSGIDFISVAYAR